LLREASRVPTSGGVYGVIEAAFGPLAGYVSGTPALGLLRARLRRRGRRSGRRSRDLFPQSLIGPVRGAVIVASSAVSR